MGLLQLKCKNIQPGLFFILLLISTFELCRYWQVILFLSKKQMLKARKINSHDFSLNLVKYV